MRNSVTTEAEPLAGRSILSQPWPSSSRVDAGGHLLLKYSLLGLVPLLGIAAWQGQTAIVTLLGLTIGTIAVSLLWSRLSLARVRCERTLSTRVLFPGEPLTITLRLVNAKPLPLPWVEVNQPLPPLLTAPDGPDLPPVTELDHSTSLSWYARVTWRHQLTLPRRGRYLLPPVTITSGDVLGLYPRQIEDPGPTEVTVYPRIYPVRKLTIPRSDSSGDLIGASSLQEDPTRTRGLRDYQPQDGLRRVHWKASAHHGELKVKVLEPAAVSKLRLVFAADNLADDQLFEFAVSAVASAARYCIEHGIPVGLSSNAHLPYRQAVWHVAEGSGASHLTAILETLTDVAPASENSLASLSRELRSNTPDSKGIIVVTGTLGDAQVREFSALARRHASLTVLEVSRNSTQARFPFGYSRVAGPEDLLDMEAG